MKITSCETAWYRVPRHVFWPLELGDTKHSVSNVDLIVCTLRTDEGVDGMGYSYTLGHGGSAVHALLREEMAPLLVGRDLDDLAGLWDELWWRFHWVGRAGVVPVAMAAVDIAVWDARSKAAALPLFRFLGAVRNSIAAYGSAVDLDYRLSDVLDGVRGYVERGFTAVKCKVGRGLAEDLERISAVRHLVGPSTRVMVDANMGWSLADAAHRIRAMEDLDLTWVEEPLIPEDVEGHAELQAGTPVAIAAGETLFSPYEFRNYFQRNAIRIAQPDVTRLGGITGWLRVADLAEAHQVPLAPHFMPDVHVHLLCARRIGLILEYLPWFDHFIEEPLIIRDGQASPPERAGHGIRFRVDVLRPHLMGVASAPALR